MDIDIQQYDGVYFDEAAELLADAERQLLALDPHNPDLDGVNAIFRCAHSIKGGAGTFGFTALADTTHLLESHLDRVRNGHLALTPQIIDLLLEANDNLREQLNAYRSKGVPDAGSVAGICARLRELNVQGGDAGGLPGAKDKPRATLEISFSRLPGDIVDALRQELEILGSVRNVRSAADAVELTLETSCSPDEIKSVCCFLIDDDQIAITQPQRGEAAAGQSGAPTAAPIAAAPVGAAAAQHAKPAAAAKDAAKEAVKDASSIRVDVGKLEKLVNEVGELVITQAMLSEAASKLDPVTFERFLTGLGHLERNALDLQETVMSIRMLPMDSVFSRYPRVIRDTSAKLGKQVRLETYGKETELDKGLIERIVDPLTHLVRNSLDHGIEMPQERIAAGKDPIGRLLLSAQHRGGSIVVEVTDDGAGLNRERILTKAAKQGLPVSESMTDDEVWQLIFLPGFSTAEHVTEISGRGVGMDVVKRNIQAMGGHVEVSSRAGKGTTTRIVLPLTLAILNGMSVRVGQEIYILPLNYVVESLQPDAEDLHSVTRARKVIRVRGEYLPLIELHQVFAVPNARRDPLQAILVIVQVGENRFALMVDELVGQHQVVVKNLETNYRRVPGISAATILGDGSVALIVDIAAMQRVQGAGAGGDELPPATSVQAAGLVSAHEAGA